MEVQSKQVLNRWMPWISLAALLILFLWLAGWTGTDQPSLAGDALHVLFTSAPAALSWIGAAIGLGWPLRVWLMPKAQEGFAIQIGLGIAGLLFIDTTLGSIGILQLGGSLVAWGTLACGFALLFTQIAKWFPTQPKLTRPPWLIWTAVPAISVLVVASCSAPGWLWSSEFGGYDALSYHLQLPKEWLALGRIQPLHHNVYSYFPSSVEAAYYHLAILTRDGIRSVYACQMLHTEMTLISAWMVYRLARQFTNVVGGAIAAVIFLGTPWVIVVGSLGYNELAVVLMLLTGLLIVCESDNTSWRTGISLGFVAGAACGAKLTALGMVAVPLGIILLMNTAPRRWVSTVLACVFASTIAFAPYLLRNFLDSGNPLFPFASGVFGLGHWTAEQHAAFAHGHLSDASIGHRLVDMWNQVLRYGIGPNPYSSDEPWKSQWSILPWLSMFGITLGLVSQKLRRISMQIAIILIMQLLFWFFFTHLKSRFMLPGVVPMALGVAVGVSAVGERIASLNVAGKGLLVIALLGWSIQPVLNFRSERNSAPAAATGQVGTFTGDDLNEQDRLAAGAGSFPAVALNYLLPQDSKVLLIGDAAPLYFRDHIVYQTTWDRGPLSQLMRQFPNDPERWRQSLLAQGFTHLLVGEEMLQRWEKDGWNDPLITRQRVMGFAQRCGEQVHQYGGFVKLYRLRR